jgi:HAMP domain-containing protein
MRRGVPALVLAAVAIVAAALFAVRSIEPSTSKIEPSTSKIEPSTSKIAVDLPLQGNELVAMQPMLNAVNLQSRLPEARLVASGSTSRMWSSPTML